MTWFTLVLNSIDDKDFFFRFMFRLTSISVTTQSKFRKTRKWIKIRKSSIFWLRTVFFARFDILIRKCTRWPLLLVGRRYAQTLFETAKLTSIIALDLLKSECICCVIKIWYGKLHQMPHGISRHLY